MRELYIERIEVGSGPIRIPKTSESEVFCPLYGCMCPLNFNCDADPKTGRPIAECPYRDDMTRNWINRDYTHFF